MGPKHILGASEAFLFYNKPIKYSSYKAGAGESEEHCSNIQVCKTIYYICKFGTYLDSQKISCFYESLIFITEPTKLANTVLNQLKPSITFLRIHFNIIFQSMLTFPN